MPRRARSGLSMGLLLPLAAALLLVFGGGFAAFRFLNRERSEESSFRGVSLLDVANYLENGNSLQGNTYQVTGLVEDQLKWTPAQGRVVSVLAQGNPLPVKIPPEFGNQTIQTGEEYLFKVQVEQDGLLVARALRKI